MVLECASYQNEYSHVIANRRSSFLCLEGASGFFTMPIHIATQRAINHEHGMNICVSTSQSTTASRY